MSTYRDDLEAAHARIGELEKERQLGVDERRLAAPVLAVGVRYVARSISASNKRSEEKHLELLDAEIAKLELR